MRFLAAVFEFAETPMALKLFNNEEFRNNVYEEFKAQVGERR